MVTFVRNNNLSYYPSNFIPNLMPNRGYPRYYINNPYIIGTSGIKENNFNQVYSKSNTLELSNQKDLEKISSLEEEILNLKKENSMLTSEIKEYQIKIKDLEGKLENNNSSNTELQLYSEEESKPKLVAKKGLFGTKYVEDKEDK